MVGAALLSFQEFATPEEEGANQDFEMPSAQGDRSR